MKLYAAAATLLLAACATAATRAPADDAFYVMRHLQKESGQDPGLTEEGRRCAAALARDFGRSNVRAIYASTTRRALETAAPLSTAAGVAVTPYDPRETAALVARVRAESGSVLVVGHSNTVPDIVEQLGGARPADLTEDRFGEIWRVARAGGAVTVRRITGC
jgi:broad specificity phosphatase PhoE